jgi:hypothetical protein
MNRNENIAIIGSNIVACVFVATGMVSEPLLSNSRLFWLYYSGLLRGGHGHLHSKENSYYFSFILFFFKIRKISYKCTSDIRYILENMQA